MSPRSLQRGKASHANDDHPHAKVDENRLSVAQAVDLLLLDSKVRNLSPASVLFYRKSLKELLRIHGERSAAAITTADLRAFFEPGRTIQTYRAVRRLFRFLVLEGEIAQNPLRRIPKPREQQKVVEPLTPAEVKRLYEHARQWKPGYLGSRDGAMIATLVGTGIRRQELCLMKDKDVRLDQGVMLVQISNHIPHLRRNGLYKYGAGESPGHRRGHLKRPPFGLIALTLRKQTTVYLVSATDYLQFAFLVPLGATIVPAADLHYAAWFALALYALNSLYTHGFATSIKCGKKPPNEYYTAVGQFILQDESTWVKSRYLIATGLLFIATEPSSLTIAIVSWFILYWGLQRLSFILFFTPSV